MKTLLLFTLIIVPRISHAQSVFDQYMGCYHTLSVDGKPIEVADPIQTEIGQDESPYLDADTSALIPAKKLFIYTGKIDGLHHMQLSYLPTDRGSVLSDETGDHYSFDGKIRFTSKPESIYNLHIKINFKFINDTGVELTIFNKFDEAGGPGKTTSFTLEKTGCSAK